LRLRQPEGTQPFDQVLDEGVPGPQHLEKDLLFEALEGLALLDGLAKVAHARKYHPDTCYHRPLDQICDNKYG
jgi:hypothetical protein